MLHEPDAHGHDAHDHHAAPYVMRLGVWMFAIYLIFYSGFVFINLYDPLLMERPIVAGLNLATVYGFALIIAAFVQALLYGILCHAHEVTLARGRAAASAQSTPETRR